MWCTMKELAESKATGTALRAATGSEYKNVKSKGGSGGRKRNL